MSINHKALTAANRLLASSDIGCNPRPDGVHALYQFFHSDDLWTARPIPGPDGPDGPPLRELICQCGVDRTIHTPQCSGIVIASAMFMRCRTDPTLHNEYVLCIWLPPPSESSWSALYGSFRFYPREGRYVPVSINGHYVKHPFPPGLNEAQMIVRCLKDHNEHPDRWRERYEASRLKEEDKKSRDHTPARGARFWEVRDRLQSRMTLHGQRPGTKGTVSRFSAPASAPLDSIPILQCHSPLDERLAPEAHLPDYTPVAEKPLIQLAN